MEPPLVQTDFEQSLSHAQRPKASQQRQREPVRPYGIRGPPPVERGRAPLPEGLEDRQQLLAAPGEFVDVRRAGRRQTATGGQAVALHVLQPGGQDVGADARQIGVQVGVAARAAEQFADDQEGPPVPDGVEGTGGGTVLVVASAR